MRTRTAVFISIVVTVIVTSYVIYMLEARKISAGLSKSSADDRVVDMGFNIQVESVDSAYYNYLQWVTFLFQSGSVESVQKGPKSAR